MDEVSLSLKTHCKGSNRRADHALGTYEEQLRHAFHGA